MNEKTEPLETPGVMVIDVRGRVGMISEVYLRTCRVQYGQAGPHATVTKKSLRVATILEIRRAGLEGVGRMEL